MKMKGERDCYQYVCPKYPECKRACGKGCCIDFEEPPQNLIGKGECTEENGYPFFMKLTSQSDS